MKNIFQGRNDFLGEVMISLQNKVFDNPQPQWYQLEERVGYWFNNKLKLFLFWFWHSRVNHSKMWQLIVVILSSDWNSFLAHQTHRAHHTRMDSAYESSASNRIHRRAVVIMEHRQGRHRAQKILKVRSILWWRKRNTCHLSRQMEIAMLSVKGGFDWWHLVGVNWL